MLTLKKARSKAKEWYETRSSCPICKEIFKHCNHTAEQAHEKLNEDIIRAIVRDEINKNKKICL